VSGSGCQASVGKYHGTYGGQDFTTWQIKWSEDFHNRSGWVAECPAIGVRVDGYTLKRSTRDPAVRHICR
jgi:hypothetical protein